MLKILLWILQICFCLGNYHQDLSLTVLPYPSSSNSILLDYLLQISVSIAKCKCLSARKNFLIFLWSLNENMVKTLAFIKRTFILHHLMMIMNSHQSHFLLLLLHLHFSDTFALFSSLKAFLYFLHQKYSKQPQDLSWSKKYKDDSKQWGSTFQLKPLFRLH